ncbi:NYN domain [Macleaya cordata]|uniref:NYN domain n=1 Tax=Macleaya cordata TaxID=56857 RepID=A0A200PYP1_MACCD|nr:NYN domain [Macleaya cordata]
MKTLKSKSIFLFTISSSSFSSHFLSSYSPLKTGIFHFSSSSSSSSSSWRHHDEESKNVKVSVWWDFENCQIPVGVNVVKVAQRITSALRSNGIKGPITITAFGDVLQLSRSNQEALSSTGICLSHVPRGGKNSADRSLLIDLVYWTSQNPPPAHLLLISGDRDFANILHRLRMSNYNILLASTESAPDVLCSAASIMWSWNSLVRGVSLTGKHFNQPPDGPYGSWYGHYKGPLEDPFSDMDQPASSKLENCADPSTDVKPRPLPKALVCRIRQIVNAFPEGVDISEVRSELVKSNVLDKEFFGRKKFSHLLKSLPDMLKLQRTKDGQILVHGIQPEVADSVESNSKWPTGFETNKDDRDHSAAAELSGGESAMVADATGKSLSPPVDPQKEDLPPVRDASTTLCSSNHVGEALELSHSNETSCNVPVKSSTTFDGSERTTTKVESAESKSHHPDPLDPTPTSSSSDVNTSVLEEKIAKSSGEDDNKPGLSTGFVDKILNWFGFWRTSTNADHASGKVDKDVNCISSQSENHEPFSIKADHASGKSGKDERLINSQAENHELLSTNSFWDEMESFVCSSRGSSLISQSRTR